MGRLLVVLMVVHWSYASSPDQERYPPPQEQGGVKAVVDAVRYALFGSPSFFAEQKWDFDPEVAKRRSKEFQAINGYQGRRLVESLGLGVDGRQEERRVEQAVRDSGIPVAYRR